MYDQNQDSSSQKLANAAQTAQQAAKIANQVKNTSNAAKQGAQAAHTAVAAAKSGGAVAGAATGTAVGGPLGAVVGFLVTNKTFWKVIGGIIIFMFLFLYLIANIFGILLSYLGFGDADMFANQAQSSELSSTRLQIEKILDNEEYKLEIISIIDQIRDKQIKQIKRDRKQNYEGYELTIIDECETRLKKNLEGYLAVLLLENCDSGTIQTFLGNSNFGNNNMTTDLTSPYDEYFDQAAKEHNVPVALLKAMAMVESGFNPNAVSGAGAIGIMQLMPSTAASLGVTDPFDPLQNIMGGAKYIAELLNQFSNYPNCVELAIAGYNAGPGAVVKYGYTIPPYSETQNHVKKVMGYIKVQEAAPPKTEDQNQETEDLSNEFTLLKNAISDNADKLFSWAKTAERESSETEIVYYFESADDKKTEITKETYDDLALEGETVSKEEKEVTVKKVEYTIALLLNSSTQNGSGYKYKLITDKKAFDLLIKVLRLMIDGVNLQTDLFKLFDWRDFVNGGGNGGSNGNYSESDIDTSGDIITYDTVANCVKKVVYFNQTEQPWKDLPYSSSSIEDSGCGPTSMSIIISTLTGKIVNPQTTCNYAAANGEYVPRSGTSHSFIANAAHHWGLTSERFGKGSMSHIIEQMKKGKMVVVICHAGIFTRGGHFIVLTGVDKNGYITVADPASRERSAKSYSVDTILANARGDVEPFWIIGK